MDILRKVAAAPGSRPKVMSLPHPAIDVDFPLCAGKDEEESAREAVLEAVRFLREESEGLTLLSVILAGSFSRGEGSVLLDRGAPRVLGDIEFMVIVGPPFKFSELRRFMRLLSEKATGHLRERSLDAVIEYSPAGLSFLERAIRPSIFAFDLLVHGKTVFGDPRLLESVPRFEASAIPREDAIRLVMNRIMEIHALRLRGNVERLLEAYVAVKTVLDLAGSVLAFHGRHESSYAARLRALAALDADPPFASRLERQLPGSVAMKLHPDEHSLVRNAPCLADALELATQVWRWEAELLFGGENVSDLLDGFLASEKMWQTLRGWVKYYTHPLRPPGESLSPFRGLRLFFRSSPQRLAYASALLAHDAERSGASCAGKAERLLPSAGPGSPLPRAVDLWSWLVRNN